MGLNHDHWNSMRDELVDLRSYRQFIGGSQDQPPGVIIQRTGHQLNLPIHVIFSCGGIPVEMKAGLASCPVRAPMHGFGENGTAGARDEGDFRQLRFRMDCRKRRERDACEGAQHGNNKGSQEGQVSGPRRFRVTPPESLLRSGAENKSRPRLFFMLVHLHYQDEVQTHYCMGSRMLRGTGQ